MSVSSLIVVKWRFKTGAAHSLHNTLQRAVHHSAASATTHLHGRMRAQPAAADAAFALSLY
jgi:hypothetical protein